MSRLHTAQSSAAAFAGSRVAQDIGEIARGAGELLLNTFLVLFGAIFFAVDPKIYERGFLLMIPPSKRAAVEDALGDVASTLLLWLRAQLIHQGNPCGLIHAYRLRTC